jgi:hypothetical protein
VVGSRPACSPVGGLAAKVVAGCWISRVVFSKINLLNLGSRFENLQPS